MSELKRNWWFESVPRGLTWFCGECTAKVAGFSEVEEDEAMAAMEHEPTCRWLLAGVAS